jgi:hypothetical protein
MDACDAGQSRALFKCRAQLLQIFRGADGKNLNTAIAPVTNVAIQSQFAGDMLDVVAKADSLHSSRNNVTSPEYLTCSSRLLRRALLVCRGVVAFHGASF